MKKILFFSLIISLILSMNCCSLFIQTNETSIRKDLTKHTIVDVRGYNSKLFVVTNFEVLRYSVKNEIFTFEQRGLYCLPKKSNFSDLSKIGILHIDEKLIVIQVNDFKSEKDTLYFIDSKTCQKISERVLDGYRRIVCIKTNPHELVTSDSYYLLAVPGSNIGITLEKVSYTNQQIKWTYSPRYSGWNLEGVLFIDHDKLLLSNFHTDRQHYQINLINTQDGTTISQKLIEKSSFSNLRLTQVTDRTFFIFDFTDTGVTTSLWELKSDNTLIKNWSKVLEGVKRENISGFTNESPYIYFLHKDELSQDGTLWYIDLWKGKSIPIKMKEVPDEIHRASPRFVTSIGGKMFLYLTSIKPNTKLYNLSIFLINQADGSVILNKQSTVESYYDGSKGLIFGSKQPPFFVSGNTAAFVWNEDKVEIINLSDGKSKNLITKKGFYQSFNSSFFIQVNETLIWIRDDGDYDFVRIDGK
jgi:hypothetical protein